MTTSLRSQLDDLASSFIRGTLAAIRGASIEDLLAESAGGAVRRAPGRPPSAAGGASRAGRRSGRLPRRSASDIGKVIDGIVALVKGSPRGMRAEEIRVKLGMQANEMPRPLREAVAAGRLGKSGQKRATTYFAKGSASAVATPARKSETGRGGRGGKARKARAGGQPARRARKAPGPRKAGRTTKARKASRKSPGKKK